MAEFFPPLNALLNATAGVLLVIGWRHIRAGRREAHRRAMLAAFGISVVFLVSYLASKAISGTTRFPDLGWIRSVYLLILLTHTLLAPLVAVGALAALWLAWRERFDAHRRLARWLFPCWMYVSVTGVVIYLMLFQLAPWLTGSGG